MKALYDDLHMHMPKENKPQQTLLELDRMLERKEEYLESMFLQLKSSLLMEIPKHTYLNSLFRYTHNESF